MKGFVFTEFFELVESRFGFSMSQRILDMANPASGGIYTAVGTYPNSEMKALVRSLSEASGLSESQLYQVYGEYLFRKLVDRYQGFIVGKRDALTLLESINDQIHVEVRKLYPDAELPSFSSQRTGLHQLILEYRSDRGMAALAHGLILGCGHHYQEQLEIANTDLSGGAQTHVRFTINRIQS